MPTLFSAALSEVWMRVTQPFCVFQIILGNTITITENKRIFSTLEKAKMVNDSFKIKLKTKVLNDFIKEVVKKKQPPYVKGKNLSIKYVAQIFKAPPIFIFFVNYPDLFPVSYKRYLENQFRYTFDYTGVPIKISFRKK